MASASPVSLSDPSAVRAGTKLGRYEILLAVAQGGMARVWAAKQHGQRGFSKVVAIKTILPALAVDPDFEAMFLDEARVASGVHHPNVCEIFDLGEEAGVLYLAMEWVRGDSLARILKPPSLTPEPPKAQALNVRWAARIISDACAGLHAAHELTDDNSTRLNVVHRDVSPQNILVSVDGTVKVTDFGVAKALGSSQEATSAGQIKGKAAYMSPEQASGGRIDRRSDIFALGICLYEVTTGRRPFVGDNQVATLKLLIEGKFDPPSAVVPGYPRELETIVMRAMAMEPMQRFPTADRMRVALEEFLARSGPVVTQTQVGQLVRERVGEVVELRRSRIRELMQAAPSPDSGVTGSGVSYSAPTSEASSSKISNPSAPSASAASYVASTSSLNPPSHSQPAAAKRNGNPVLAGIAAGLLLFLVVGGVGGVLYVMRTKQRQAAAPPPPTAAPATPAPSAPPVKRPPPVTTTEAAFIEIRPVVPEAGLSYQLDGKPFSLKKIERPRGGKIKLLKVTADGFHDEVMRIDEATPDVLDILLAKKDEPAPAAKPEVQTKKAEPRAEKKPEPKESKGQKPINPDIPDNPFQ